MAQLDNHFGLYLYGKQIVDGVKPFWDGSDPYMTGNIAVWTAARQHATSAAVPARMAGMEEVESSSPTASARRCASATCS
jgi:hypothetical protein